MMSMARTAVVDAAGAHLNDDFTGLRRRSGCAASRINLRLYLKWRVCQTVVYDEFCRRGSTFRCKSLGIFLIFGSTADYVDPVLNWILGIHRRDPLSNSCRLGIGYLVAVGRKCHEKLP
ncbi:hypothetical protein BCEN4_170004 [Burkholderia cenocepacia]|nr:hypothetical protein BCEN4_170004 [Burkholderia cenocepacia]